MKQIWVLTTSIMNGTVTMGEQHYVFTSKELAEKTKEAVEKANENNNTGFCIVNTISDSFVYERYEDVPILNNVNKKNI